MALKRLWSSPQYGKVVNGDIMTRGVKMINVCPHMLIKKRTEKYLRIFISDINK